MIYSNREEALAAAAKSVVCCIRNDAEFTVVPSENCIRILDTNKFILFACRWRETPEKDVQVFVNNGESCDDMFTHLRLSTGTRHSNGQLCARKYGDSGEYYWKYYQVAKTENGKLLPADPEGWL